MNSLVFVSVCVCVSRVTQTVTDEILTKKISGWILLIKGCNEERNNFGEYSDGQREH